MDASKAPKPKPSHAVNTHWANCVQMVSNDVGNHQRAVTGLTSGVNYKWRVMGENDNGQTWSAVQSFTTS